MKKQVFLERLAKFSYILALAIFILSNLIPLNKMTSFEVYKKNKNLFLPTIYSFLVLAPIYWLIARYFLYSLKDGAFLESIRKEQLKNFIFGSIATISWIVFWHYEKQELSMIAIGLIFTSLYRMSSRFKGQIFILKEEKITRAVFDFYLGWVSIGFISNALIFMETYNLLAFGISIETWTLTFLIIGLLFSISILNNLQSEYYGFGVLWAYVGIVLKHILGLEFAFQYKNIIGVCLMVIAFIALGIYDIKKGPKKYII